MLSIFLRFVHWYVVDLFQENMSIDAVETSTQTQTLILGSAALEDSLYYLYNEAKFSKKPKDKGSSN